MADEGARQRNGEGTGSDPSSLLATLAEMFGLGRKTRNGDVSLSELQDIITEDGEGLPPEAAHERALLVNILKLRDLTAEDVMVPRADIVAVEAGIHVDELVAAMRRDAHSRVPVYRETLDDVIGIIHIKDLLAHWGVHGPLDWNSLIRTVPFISPSMRALDLLQQMRAERVQMALVVDEYGGVDGLITIEDLVEEIVGEIEDEHDVDEGPKLEPQADGSLIVDARLDLEAFEELVGEVFEDEERDETDTLGGLVFLTAGHVPGRGEVIRHDSGLEFEVLDGDARRVRRLRVRQLPPEAVEKLSADYPETGRKASASS